MKNLLWLFTSLFVFSASYAYADTPAAPANQRFISVSGEAKQDFTPDQAILSISLNSRDKDLNTAKRANDQMVEKLVKIAKDFNIPTEKVGTSSVNVSPEYDYDNNSHKQIFRGYMISRSLRITMDKLDIHERVLSAIVDAKIDQVNGIEFQLADPESHLQALRAKAVANAKARAEQLAQAAGVKVGIPIAISLGENATPPMMPRPMMMMAKSAMADSSVAPSLPGLITLQENVSITYAIE